MDKKKTKTPAGFILYKNAVKNAQKFYNKSYRDQAKTGIFSGVNQRQYLLDKKARDLYKDVFENFL